MKITMSLAITVAFCILMSSAQNVFARATLKNDKAWLKTCHGHCRLTPKYEEVKLRVSERRYNDPRADIPYPDYSEPAMPDPREPKEPSEPEFAHPNQ